MVVLTPEIVNQTYAKHLDWYPQINNSISSPTMISGLADIIDQFDLILLDSYGVLCRGVYPIEGAREAIQSIRALNKTFRVVSNDTMTNHTNVVEKYLSRGFDFTADEVVTSLDITETFLQDLKNPESFGVIAPEDHPSQTLLSRMTRLNQLNGEIPEHVTKLLFLTGGGWTAKMQEHLVSSANGREFELFIGNPDTGAPNGDRITATPGYFLADFVERTGQNAKPTLFGKPDPVIFLAALKTSKMVNPERVLMVGDTLYTDILGGNAMGFKTLLLQCGIYQGQDIHKQIEQAGIVPDFIAPNL